MGKIVSYIGQKIFNIQLFARTSCWHVSIVGWVRDWWLSLYVFLLPHQSQVQGNKNGKTKQTNKIFKCTVSLQCDGCVDRHALDAFWLRLMLVCCYFWTHSVTATHWWEISLLIHKHTVNWSGKLGVLEFTLAGFFFFFFFFFSSSG